MQQRPLHKIWKIQRRKFFQKSLLPHQQFAPLSHGQCLTCSPVREGILQSGLAIPVQLNLLLLSSQSHPGNQELFLAYFLPSHLESTVLPNWNTFPPSCIPKKSFHSGPSSPWIIPQLSMLSPCKVSRTRVTLQCLEGSVPTESLPGSEMNASGKVTFTT